MAAAFDLKIKYDRVALRMEHMPDEVRGELVETRDDINRDLLTAVQAHVQALTRTRSGKYLKSFKTIERSSKRGVTGGVRSRAPQAGILEFGGETAAHTISAKVATVLAFTGDAGTVFARTVWHPGSTFMPRNIVHGAFDPMKRAIADRLEAAVRAGARKD